MTSCPEDISTKLPCHPLADEAVRPRQIFRRFQHARVVNVTANVGPLFGSLHIVSRVLNPDKPFDINFLWRLDALKMKRIMQGHIIAMQKEIDVSSLDTPELAKMLERLGEDDHHHPRED